MDEEGQMVLNAVSDINQVNGGPRKVWAAVCVNRRQRY